MNVSKKKVSSFLIFITSILVLSSCATSVTVSYLQPAKYDLTQYKNLAIASMKVVDVPPFPDSFVTIQYDDFEDRVFTGYDRRIASNIAANFTYDLYSDLNKTSYFNIIKPVITDGYINNLKYGINAISKLRDLGADALLVSQIDYFDYKEYPIIGDYKLIKNPDYTTDLTQPEYIESSEREVTIVQQANVSYSYKVIDINTGSIIASSSFKKTLTNEVEYEENLISLPSMQSLYDKALTQGEKEIVSDLTPQYVTKSISLISDKSKNPFFDAGMEAAKKGSLRVAYDNFSMAWNNARLYAAGYNSALVLEALGDRQGAIDRMREVYNYYNKVDAYEQLSRMEQYKYDTNLAENQIKSN